MANLGAARIGGVGSLATTTRATTTRNKRARTNTHAETGDEDDDSSSSGSTITIMANPTKHLVIVGDGTVGKTCLLYAFTNKGGFKDDYEPTM